MMDDFLLLVNIFIILDLPAALHVVSHEILPPTWESARKAIGIAAVPPRGTPSKNRDGKKYVFSIKSLIPEAHEGHFVSGPVQHPSAGR